MFLAACAPAGVGLALGFSLVMAGAYGIAPRVQSVLNPAALQR
jgi:hypothetical protein